MSTSIRYPVERVAVAREILCAVLAASRGRPATRRSSTTLGMELIRLSGHVPNDGYDCPQWQSHCEIHKSELPVDPHAEMHSASALA